MAPHLCPVPLEPHLCLRFSLCPRIFLSKLSLSRFLPIGHPPPGLRILLGPTHHPLLAPTTCPTWAPVVAVKSEGPCAGHKPPPG